MDLKSFKEYVRLHLISLEQDSQQTVNEMNLIEDMDSDFFGIGFNYKFGSEPVVQEEVVEEVVETRPATRIVEHVYPAQTTATVQFDLESAEEIGRAHV